MKQFLRLEKKKRFSMNSKKPMKSHWKKHFASLKLVLWDILKHYRETQWIICLNISINISWEISH